ncbi:DUF3574 domain-containing protein [Pantoea sp. BIGb0393]|uniref:DUF3574 domain-containing protein n=1 Tax=Pantoea nemavictus TaxID=2726955 RepID=A0ABU8PS92_9GAMM|nr:MULTISPECIES: DUF3574 domain-containing protein [Pantoea]KNC13603.1 hypothetical protein AC790_09250 [Pantoea sp. RIT-PI-b]MBA0036409.1 DUF3574 domain-containing protein [Pantoea nemavictus]
MFRSVALPVLLTFLLAGCQAPSTPREQIPPNTAPVAVCGSGEVMMQTTLWFGMNKPKGGTVSSLEWQQFVDNDVTPRFKDGLSVYDAKGQWLGENGKLARENSKALMLIHHPDHSSSESINGLRDIYKKRFEQESVMRVDSLVCVAF